ncbi:MAG: hypothetical protein E4H41_10620 [Gemmatimonadales bacterium]|nr:MAG: hypothetical protein E4H41_10620 [Gemmatimonadales bacterium]
MLVGLTLLAPAPLAGQLPLSVSGQIVRLQGGDTTAMPGVTITLHRVSRTAQGAVDSIASSNDGTFRFRGAGDTTAIYLVSARYAGIEYFSEPIRAPGAGRIRIVVSDTSSSAPVRLGSRHVIIRPPDESGTRAVLDLFSIRNDGPDTRVGRDSLSPSWQVVLPSGALQPEVQEGDVSPTSIRFQGDSMFVLAPIAPGVKNVMVSYRLPVVVEHPTWVAPVDSFDLLVEEPGATVRGAGLASAAPVDLMGSTLRRWTAAPPTGGPGEVVFSGSSTLLGRALYWLVGIVGLLVLGGAGLAYRRVRGIGSVAVVSPEEDLVGALAQLDARYAGKRDQVAVEEWAAYEAERGRLKAAALARGRSRP